MLPPEFPLPCPPEDEPGFDPPFPDPPDPFGLDPDFEDSPELSPFELAAWPSFEGTGSPPGCVLVVDVGFFELLGNFPGEELFSCGASLVGPLPPGLFEG